jgi:hypothetical protein
LPDKSPAVIVAVSPVKLTRMMPVDAVTAMPNNAGLTVMDTALPADPLANCPRAATVIPGPSSPDADAAELDARLHARASASCPPAIAVENPVSACDSMRDGCPAEAAAESPSRLAGVILQASAPVAVDACDPVRAVPAASDDTTTPAAMADDCPAIEAFRPADTEPPEVAPALPVSEMTAAGAAIAPSDAVADHPLSAAVAPCVGVRVPVDDAADVPERPAALAKVIDPVAVVADALDSRVFSASDPVAVDALTPGGTTPMVVASDPVVVEPVRPPGSAIAPDPTAMRPPAELADTADSAMLIVSEIVPGDVDATLGRNTLSAICSGVIEPGAVAADDPVRVTPTDVAIVPADVVALVPTNVPTVDTTPVVVEDRTPVSVIEVDDVTAPAAEAAADPTTAAVMPADIAPVDVVAADPTSGLTDAIEPGLVAAAAPTIDSELVADNVPADDVPENPARTSTSP